MLHIPANIDILVFKIKKFSASAISRPSRTPIAGIPAQIPRLSLWMLLAFAQCNASIVLVSLTADAIYIGADGRLTGTDVTGKETAKPCDDQEK